MNQHSPINITRRIKNARRLAEITKILAQHGLFHILQAIGIDNWLTREEFKEAEEAAKSEKHSPDLKPEHELLTLPIRVRQAFEALGPTFVKLGQTLAVREDLLPQAYTDELKKLHSAVTPVPFSEIKQTLYKQLGKEQVEVEFENIQETALAAGSIGQVHLATLKNGQKVVIKIQRPGISKVIANDLDLINILANLLEKYLPESRIFQPKAVAEEFSQSITAELNFIREAGNTSKISKNFLHEDSVILPMVYWNLTSEKILTISYLDGDSSWDRDKLQEKGLDPEALLQKGLNIFLHMVFIDGHYHADLHPGNILAMEHNRIGLLDFGMTVRLSRYTREQLAGLVLALIVEDYGTVVRHFVELSTPGENFDIIQFERDITNALAPYIGMSLEKAPSGKLLFEVAKIAAKHEAPLARELILFLRNLALIEGLGRKLSPNFDVISSCQDFSKEMASELYSYDSIKKEGINIVRDVGSLARFAPVEIRKILKLAGNGQFNLNIQSNEVEKLGRFLDHSTSRLAVAIILGALIIGTSIFSYGAGSTLNYDALVVAVSVFALVGMLGLYLVVSIIRGGKF